MNNQVQQKCPACDAPMRFDPASGKMVCDYCGTTADVDLKFPEEEAPAAETAVPAEQVQSAAAETPAAEAEAKGKKKSGKKKVSDTAADIEGFDFSTYRDQAVSANAESLPVYNCVSCGAEVIAPPEQMALTCPYCGNNIVLTDKASGNLRPDGMIPFVITSESLPGAVKKFYKGKKLLPKGFFDASVIGRVTGVYVPFWVFSGNMSGRLFYNATSSSTSREGDYVVTTTNHYHLVRDVDMRFQDIPTDASGKVDDALMDSLEPFRTEEVRPFDMRYLAGFTADRFDQGKSSMAKRARSRMNSSAQSIVSARAGAGYSNVHSDGGTLKASMSARYLLFPVYMFDVSHEDKSYHFAVNGQTGRVVGNLPIDKQVSRNYFLIRFGLVSGILIAWSLLKYFCGC